MEALCPMLGPGDLEEAHQARVVDRRDRRLAVLGRRDDGEAAVGLESGPDALGSLGDLVGGDRHPHVRLERDVVPEVGRRVDDLHPERPSASRVAGDRQDRRADRLRTVAHQVVTVVAERRRADPAAPGRRPSGRRGGQRFRREPSSSSAAARATTGAVTAARVASGS